MADTGIGALLVRIGAGTSDFVSALNKADKEVGRFTDKLDKRLIADQLEGKT